MRLVDLLCEIDDSYPVDIEDEKNDKTVYDGYLWDKLDLMKLKKYKVVSVRPARLSKFDFMGFVILVEEDR